VEKDLFLCHSSVDKKWVRGLGKRIENETWNGRALSVFLDEWDIEGGDNIILKLNEGLQTSRLVAVVMSPEMMSSDWCKAEVFSVLHQDPVNRSGRILPIRFRDLHLITGQRLEVPPFLGALAYFDFRKEADYEKGVARLLAKLRGEAPPRGTPDSGRGAPHAVDLVPALPPVREGPDEVPETLISNLLPVRGVPAAIWSAKTSLTSKHELPVGLPPATVKAGRLHTFVDLSAPGQPFSAWVEKDSLTRSASVDWRVNPDKWRWFMELLNDTLRQYLASMDIGFEETHRRYFFKKDRTERTRHLRWGSGTRRWVVRAPDPGKGGYWIHHAAKLWFEALEQNIFLSVEPTMIFTTDGVHTVPKDVAGPLAMQWTGRERNGAILRHVLMWSDALTRGKRQAEIPAADQFLMIGRLPTTVHASVGIADDRVSVGALLEFTRVEVDPKKARPDLFAFLDEESPPPEDVEYDDGDGDDDDESEVEA
jgi:hypothetical protein